MATKAAQIPSTRSTKSAYEEYVNPQWVSLLNLLGLNEEYERCRGLITEEQLDVFVHAIQSTVELADSSASFWTEAMSLARRAAKI